MALDAKAQRLQAVHAVKKNLILDAALVVLARDGYEARLEDIAEEAGFSKASLYHYFQDRESLVLELILREQENLLELCGTILSRQHRFCGRLEQVIRVLFERFNTHARFSRALGDLSGTGLQTLAGMVAKQEKLFRQTQENNQRVIEVIQRMIEEAMQKGELLAPLDATTLCTYITSIMHGIVFTAHHVKKDDVNIDGEIQKLFTFLEPWLANQTGEPRQGGN
jgi:AcrR family transcriptional regulator